MKKSLFHVFIVKYAEIGIKGRNRYLFEDALVERMNGALRKIDGTFAIRKTPGRIYVDASGDFDFDETIDALQHVFGIVEINPAIRTTDRGFEELGADVTNYMMEMYPELLENKAAGVTAEIALSEDKKDQWQKELPSIQRDAKSCLRFKLNTRRNKKSYPKNSMEINEDLGEILLNRFPGLKVDVHKPELIVEVEIRDAVYIYTEVIPGPGGMPVGTGGKAMLLLSGGIDSPVAGYMISKRGVTIDAVYFHAPPYTSERAKEKVVDLAKLISKYTGPIRLHVINFTDIQLAIYEKCPPDELTIIMRRYMMRIAEKLAIDAGALGLVTGESIGQVASQTMQSMAATNEVCSLPVYRPLVAFDKQDIVDISEKIDTYETSILPYEDCCTIFVAKHPVTKPNVNVIRRHEMNLSEVIDDLLAKAFETDEIIEIGD